MPSRKTRRTARPDAIWLEFARMLLVASLALTLRSRGHLPEKDVIHVEVDQLLRDGT